MSAVFQYIGIKFKAQNTYASTFKSVSRQTQMYKPNACVGRLLLVMVALWNRAEHYIFALWFLLSSLFFPRLI